MLNKEYTIKAEVITPVHIGSGSDILPFEYFIDKEGRDYYLYRFDFNDVLMVADEAARNNLKDSLEKYNILMARIAVSEFWQKNKDKLKDISAYKIKVSEALYRKYYEKLREQKVSNESNQLIIKEFINSLGRFYVPGSSLKGSIRTCLTNENIEKTNPTEDPFKNLVITDSGFIGEEKIRVDEFKRSSPVYCQYLSKQTEFSFKIKIKSLAASYDLNFSKDLIVEKCNNFYKTEIEKYIKYLSKLLLHPDMQKPKHSPKKEKVSNLIGFLKSLLNKIDNFGQDEFILNLGFGGGYWFKSIVENKKHPNLKTIRHFIDPANPIARTFFMVDNENELLGFVKCSFK